MKGPTLPSIAGEHCIARINDTHTLYAGGLKQGVSFTELSASAWIYDWQNGIWTKMADMLAGGTSLHCHTVGQSHVIALLLEIDYFTVNVSKYISFRPAPLCPDYLNIQIPSDNTDT